MKLSSARTCVIALLLLMGKSSALSACAVCFAGKDSNLTHGLNAAISSLLCVVVPLMCGFATFFYYLAKKSRESLTAQDGTRL
jgi:hypothetical protein